MLIIQLTFPSLTQVCHKYAEDTHFFLNEGRRGYIEKSWSETTKKSNYLLHTWWQRWQSTLCVRPQLISPQHMYAQYNSTQRSILKRRVKFEAMHLFIHSFIQSFTHLLIHSFTHSFIHSFIHPVAACPVLVDVHKVAIHTNHKQW